VEFEEYIDFLVLLYKKLRRRRRRKRRRRRRRVFWIGTLFNSRGIRGTFELY
jgi:hypothetical protein